MIYAGGTINLTKPKDTDIIIPTITDDRFEEGNLNVIMYDLSKKYDLPYDFIKAVATQESDLKYAEGADDEKGIMQVRPIALKDVNAFYKEFDGNPITMEQLTKGSGSYNIQRSVEAGVAYLAMMRDKYKAESLKDMATMYNGVPNAVRSGNKKALNYANSVLNIMETIEPFKFDSFKEDNIKDSEIPDAFKDSQEDMFGAFTGSPELIKELNKLKAEIDRVTDSSKDNTNMLQDGKRLLEEAYEIIRSIEEKSKTKTDSEDKFLDKVIKKVARPFRYDDDTYP